MDWDMRDINLDPFRWSLTLTWAPGPAGREAEDGADRCPRSARWRAGGSAERPLCPGGRVPRCMSQ